MPMFLLALEWGTDSVLALVVALVALGAGGLALRRTHRGPRPFRRFRLVNKSKKRHIVVAKVTGAVASTIDLAVDSAPGQPPSPLPLEKDWDGGRCFDVNQSTVMSTSVTLEIKADGSSASRMVVIPQDLNLNWGNSQLESMDVIVTEVDETLGVPSDFGYTLQITVARYLVDFGTYNQSIDIATKQLVLPPSA